MLNTIGRVSTMDKIRSLALMALISASPAIVAQTQVSISAVPTSWRLQEYIPDNLAIWFSGSSCVNGQLLLPSTASSETKKRLWATILAAKNSGHKVFVYYSVDSTTGACLIQSYGADRE